MKMIKSLILGSAAGLLAMSGAQAADLPVKAKAVEYVKICSLYGAGFYYVPGTDTCLKLGGFLRADTTFNGSAAHGDPAWSGDTGIGDRFMNKFIDRTRTALTVDTRTATEYGVVRTFTQLDFQLSTLGGGSFAPGSTVNSASASPVLDTAGAGTSAVEFMFLQFAGFTFGKSLSAFSAPFSGLGLSGNILSSYIIGAENTSTGVNNIQYTAQFGNGVSATIGLDDPSAYNRTAVYNLGGVAGGGNSTTELTAIGTAANSYAGVQMPDVVANVKVDQAWGLFQLSGALHQVSASYNNIGAASALTAGTSVLSGHPTDAYGGAVMAALQIKNLPTGPGDDIKFQATYAKGDTKEVISTAAASPSFAMFGNGSAGTVGSVAFGATTDGVFSPTTSTVGGVIGDGSIHLTTSYGIQGNYLHNWDPKWVTNVFGGVGWVKYDATATAEYCANYATFSGAGAAGATYTCNPNYTISELGANIRWTPIANLTFSAEAIWTHLSTGFSGTANLTTPGSVLPTGTYQFKNQNTAELELRVQRSF